MGVGVRRKLEYEFLGCETLNDARLRRRLGVQRENAVQLPTWALAAETLVAMANTEVEKHGP